MLYFAHYSGDAGNSIVRETWARLIDHALSRGGVAEACSVLKSVGPRIYTGDGAALPLDSVCLHLEKAALVCVTKSLTTVSYDSHSTCKHYSTPYSFPS